MISIFDACLILGVHRQSTDAEIKERYRLLCMKYHPDRDGGVRERFDEIQEAYARLKGVARLRHFKEMEFLGEKCEACDGFGTTRQQKGFHIVATHACPICHGSGYVPHGVHA